MEIRETPDFTDWLASRRIGAPACTSFAAFTGWQRATPATPGLSAAR
jgi:hypothetical protein